MTDEHLCQLAQHGDRQAADQLARRYEHMVFGAASQFFLPGGEPDDVRQEARVGLVRAIAAFEPAYAVPFRVFAKISIRWSLITALKKARREKHGPLNESVRQGVGAGDPLAALPAVFGDPVRSLEEKEELARIARGMPRLTANERRWLIHVVNGGQYAREGDRNKQADNAVTRARRKLREAA